MNARVSKLKVLGVALADAEALVEAGLDKPSKIRQASDKELKAIPGIGAVKIKELRERFPKRE